jgi:hypothetical protein
VPEKQEIELMIVATPQKNVFEDEFSPMVSWFRRGQFGITIKHTARTWGSDIESLLTNQINSLILPEKPWRRYVRRKSTLIGILSGLFSFSAVSFGVYFANANYVQDKLHKSQEILATSHPDAEKLDFIIQYVAGNSQNLLFFQSLCFMALSIFVAIILAAWVSNLAEKQPYSYLVLTREAERAREETIKSLKRTTLLFCVSMVLNIILSVLASYIFVFLTKVWS